MATRAVITPASFSSGYRLKGVPVLLYHGLEASRGGETPLRERKYWVGAAEFRDQLRRISTQGYRTALLGEAWETTGSVKHGKPPVVLTFDDGLASHYEVAFPLLQRFGACGEFFVNTWNIGKRGFLAWEQMTEMVRAGMSFQSHGHHHIDLSRLSAKALTEELRVSKSALEDRLGAAVDFLAVPYGLLNRRVVEEALELGYRAVCNSRSLPAEPGGRTVNRIVIHSGSTPGEFRQLIAGDPLVYAARSVRAALAYLPRRVLLWLRPSLLGVRVLEEPA